MRLLCLVLSLIVMGIPLIASADEQLTPLAANGDWVAFEHRESMEDPPDFCVASAVQEHLILRQDRNDIEVRFVNDNWSLPSGVNGMLTLKINGNSYALPITSNTNDMVIAVINQSQLESITGDMNKSGSMTVTAGSSSPSTVSLTGSNQAVTAFLTCAGVQQPGNTGGVNPFQTTATK